EILQHPTLTAEELTQDEDVLDTWFSSWLWPIAVFDGIRFPDNKEITYYYPTNDLVTAPEILFFWVARMIMAGQEYRQAVPFHNVYLTGIVRDKLGRKMSKSLGNSPDPLMLIAKYGADGVRMGMLLTSPAGNDLPFDESLCEQGRNFCNKVWNALRLIKGWEIDHSLAQPEGNRAAVDWFDAKFNHALHFIDEQYEKYRLSDALMAVYKLIWDDFCSWYLEMIKPGYQLPVDATTYTATLFFMDRLMRVLHPFMPFLTEEIWQSLEPRSARESIMVAEMPVAVKYDERLLEQFEIAAEVIQAIRAVRLEKNLPFKETLQLFVKKNVDAPVFTFDPLIIKLCNLESLKYVEEKVDGASSFIISSTEFYLPLSGHIDVEAELKRLQEELEYTRGFLKSVEKKLSNARFVANAPVQVVEMERKKQEDAQNRILVLEQQITTWKS
ncbi:MAG: class I tRNA ligase family protein, partial [Bacteroidales bacterium]|nr:class I tRNA ligase family protein [Bacteroidales bacterium]